MIHDTKNLVTSPWPFFGEDEIQAVDEVLRSGKVNYWTGSCVKEFEKQFAEYLGTEYAVALANGSVALELAVHSLGLKAGDEVVVTPRTFIASASSAAIHGIRPVFADVDRDSGNITAETIERVITPQTKAIICVHLAGWPCEMDPILDLACSRNLKVIEDCAQCHGAAYKGRRCGSFGDAAAYSFCQDKIMTTGGEGGMLVTHNKDLWSYAWSFKDHGKSWEATHTPNPKPGFRYVHESLGTNWRMTEMQAAIGIHQLQKLDSWVSTRRRNASILIDKLAESKCLRIPVPTEDFYHAYYKLYAYVVPEQLKAGWSRDRIMTECISRGVPCYTGSCSEIYKEKAFQGIATGDCPVARELGETSLMFMVHPTLSEEQMHEAADRIQQVMDEAFR